MEGFLTLAEFSIALAGFTSIVVVFVHKNEVWDAFDKFRIVNALLSSIGASFLATVPYGLLYLGVPENSIWQLETVILAVYLLTVLISTLIRKKTLLSPEQSAKIPKIPVAVINSTGLLLVVILMLSLIKLIPINLKGLCFFVIIYLMLISVFAFSRIIFYRPEGN